MIINSLVQISQYFIFLYRVRYTWHSILEPNKIVSKLHGFDLGSWLISLMINDVKAKGIHWANLITWGYFEHLKLSSIHVFPMARESLSRDVRIIDSWSLTQQYFSMNISTCLFICESWKHLLVLKNSQMDKIGKVSVVATCLWCLLSLA